MEDFDKETIKEALKIQNDNSKSIDLHWELKLIKFDDILILKECNYTSGMPKKEFLKRLVNIRQYIKTARQMEPFETLLKTAFTKLEEEKFDGNHIELKVRECESIMGILTIPEFNANAIKWIKENGELIGFGLLRGLSHGNMYLATETSYATTYLIRFIQSDIQYVTSQSIVKGCMDMISMRSIEVEDYIIEYRNERRKQDDAELFIGKELPFHFQKFKYKDKAKEKTAISCGIFTLCFLLHYNPFPSIVLFFLRRAYKRKGIVRYILFSILLSAIKNIKVELMEEDEEWRKLPGMLYNDLVRALSESNLYAKAILNEILHVLQEKSMMKLPVMVIHINQAIDLYKQKNE